MILIKFFKIFFWMISKIGSRRRAVLLERQGRAGEASEIVRDTVCRWGRYFVEQFAGKNPPVEVSGLEKIPQGRASVFVANHQSAFDIMALLGWSGRPMGFIAKKELEKIPLIPPWMRLMRCVFLARGNAKKSVEAMRLAVENVRQGHSLVIFPEGTRSKTLQIAPFKAGSFKLALRAEAPIVPVTIDGTRAFFEDRKKKRNSARKIVLTFHEPVETAGISKEDAAALPEKILSAVKSCYKAL